MGTLIGYDGLGPFAVKNQAKQGKQVCWKFPAVSSGLAAIASLRAIFGAQRNSLERALPPPDTTIHLGVYGDNAGLPGLLLASGSWTGLLPEPAGGFTRAYEGEALNLVEVPLAPHAGRTPALVAGAHYWLAILCTTIDGVYYATETPGSPVGEQLADFGSNPPRSELEDNPSGPGFELEDLVGTFEAEPALYAVGGAGDELAMLV